MFCDFLNNTSSFVKVSNLCLSKFDSFQTLQDSECIKAYCNYIAMIITIIIIIYILGYSLATYINTLMRNKAYHVEF